MTELFRERVYYRCELTIEDSLILLPVSWLKTQLSIANKRWNTGEAAARMNLWAEKPILFTMNITSVC